MAEHTVFTTDIVMRFRDIDAMGHVNNAVYFTYFEHGRWRFFYSESQKDQFPGLSFILAHVRCDYLRPLTLEKDPVLHMWILDIGNKSFSFHYQLSERSDPSVVYATGKSVQVLFDYQKNVSVPLTDLLKTRLSAYLKLN
jgi:acyl-CoA thioester hydrolase